ncbi:hypothetical protein EYF80_055290 [Liparis tanakae]|uniref:Uncharacterized protein n=1 Tax=Liparis tanakae TaxID=230148 RepID=A0A4Z2EZY1_9TELE|nr:hypothetical protein EYF80_055290 [Liparis tanakae]
MLCGCIPSRLSSPSGSESWRSVPRAASRGGQSLGQRVVEVSRGGQSLWQRVVEVSPSGSESWRSVVKVSPSGSESWRSVPRAASRGGQSLWQRVVEVSPSGSESWRHAACVDVGPLLTGCVVDLGRGAHGPHGLPGV